MKPTQSVLLIALVGEGALYILSLPWLLHSGWDPVCAASGAMVAAGTVAALLLFGLSFRWIEALLSHEKPSAYRRLYKEVLLPLASSLSGREIFLIAFLSGTAEEILFRGAIPWYLTSLGFGTLLAHGVSNFAFASVHFIGSFREFGRLIPMYFCVGCLLSWLALSFDSLMPAMICHGLVNFLSLSLLKIRSQSS
ncbi:MAG: CPBP family intramembrane metalloprotease [Bdellovibrionales bacterium]|nr:CPBP family intramembrane metalloprotease [Bdellovibrionales bacterium]